MKHARDDYNRIQDPSGKIPEDEPVFLLRGQDLFAPSTLNHWAECMIVDAGQIMVQIPKDSVAEDDVMAKKTAENQIAMANLAIEHAKTMENWQKLHGYKIPDMPNKVGRTDSDVFPEPICPSGYMFGKDADEYDECDECPIYSDCLNTELGIKKGP